jgi:iron(III) transport system substrate-binding protein
MKRALAFLLCTSACLFALGLSGCGTSISGDPKTRVVLYCAQDREFAEDILKEFTTKTGVEVAPRFDTEANKSVSLYEDLVREARRPRCDVHWNNEILGTIRLERQGLLEPYASPSATPYPDQFKAKDSSWHAFAARARVLVINTQKVARPDWPRGLLDLTLPRWRGQVAMAKPQFGTSATQAACLFQAWGPEKARAFYQALRQNDVQIVPGNKQVAEGVAQGQFAVGITDTDDAIAEVEAGRPLALVYPDRDAPPDSQRGTLFIPNTVALIRACPNPEGARRLIDYLLSAEVEAKLAQSASRQIPLNPQVQIQLPGQIETPRTARPMPVDFARAVDFWNEAQTFLIAEFAKR